MGLLQINTYLQLPAIDIYIVLSHMFFSKIFRVNFVYLKRHNQSAQHTNGQIVMGFSCIHLVSVIT